MNYLKSLFYNFLIAFFANHMLPGIDVVNQTKLPHIGGDLIFAVALGLLNSLIYPVLKMSRQGVSLLKMALISLILNFGAYGVIKLIPIGVLVHSVEGYICASAIVAVGGFLTNYFEMKRSPKMDVPPQ